MNLSRSLLLLNVIFLCSTHGKRKMINSSTMTNDEFYKINGTMSDERINAMLDSEGNYEEMHVGNFQRNAQEALAGMIDKDFLCDEVDYLKQFGKSMRGNNKVEFMSLVKRIEDALKQQIANSEYGKSELQKIIDA